MGDSYDIDWWKIRRWFSLRHIWTVLWWKYMPGVEVSVRWPSGIVEIGYQVKAHSADPSDHYRPWLEENVGRQNWDWNWDLRYNDAAENRLTIKFRKGKTKWATIAGIMWS